LTTLVILLTELACGEGLQEAELGTTGLLEEEADTSLDENSRLREETNELPGKLI